MLVPLDWIAKLSRVSSYALHTEDEVGEVKVHTS